MPRLNLPLAFAELLAGAIILDAGIKGASIADVVRGQAKQSPLTGDTASASTGGGSGSGQNPFGADAQGSRLDQGADLTAKEFHAPVSGTIVIADQSNPGWRGGGYIALKADQAIRGLATDTLYFAEGIRPTVTVGQHVNAGDQLAVPVPNPYNGTPGNIEWGPADPNSPGRPLAQAVSDARSMVMAFYSWARSIGAPVASSTSNAGYA